MLIILEGCDGAGKTSVMEHLAGALRLSGDVTTLHAGPLLGDPITAYEDPLDDYRPGDGRHIICDRWHLGELVYGPLLRGESKLDDAMLLHVHKFLEARGAVVVHLTAATQTLRRRLEERGDDLISTKQIPDIVDGFHRVTHSFPVALDVHTILTDLADEPRHIASTILSIGRFSELEAAPLARFSTYIGPRDPDFLLLGERRNPQRVGDGLAEPRSAFTPRPSTSGHFLMRALTPDVAYRAGIANALEEDIVDLWETLRRPQIVALGREAAAQCTQAELPFGTVPHPQYVRRFHSQRITDYGRSIRAAAYHREDLRGFAHPSA